MKNSSKSKKEKISMKHNSAHNPLPIGLDAKKLLQHNEELKKELEKKHIELSQALGDVQTLKAHIYTNKPIKISNYLKIIIPIAIFLVLLLLGYVIYNSLNSSIQQVNNTDNKTSYATDKQSNDSITKLDDTPVYAIDVGTYGDVDSSKELYINQTNALSSSKFVEGKRFRELHGITQIIFKPKEYIGGGEFVVSISGDDVSLIPQNINFNYRDYEWDIEADFIDLGSKWGISSENMSVEYREGCGGYFDGTFKAFLPDTYEDLESGPFTVYAEWTPMKSNESVQEIAGHYNWELFQDTDAVKFQIGRMDDANGTFHIIKFPVGKDFFDKPHSLIAIYNPSLNQSLQGYIELHIDGKFFKRTGIGDDIIWTNYGKQDLSIGKSNHGSSACFTGCIRRFMFIDQALNPLPNNLTIKYAEGIMVIPILGKGKLENVQIVAKKK